MQLSQISPFYAIRAESLHVYSLSLFQTANKSWKNAVRHGLIMGNWFKKLENPNNHKACLWSFHPTAFGAIHKQVFKLLGSFRAETEATMAYPQFLNCILEGVIKPSMVQSLYKFQEALKVYWEKSGRTPQLCWWHENAPWMPNGGDRQRKLLAGKTKSTRGYEIPVHAAAAPATSSKSLAPMPVTASAASHASGLGVKQKVLIRMDSPEIENEDEY